MEGEWEEALAVLEGCLAEEWSGVRRDGRSTWSFCRWMVSFDTRAGRDLQ